MKQLKFIFKENRSKFKKSTNHYKIISENEREQLQDTIVKLVQQSGIESNSQS